MAEYSTSGTSGGGTSYLTSDVLGTPRIITGSNINDQGEESKPGMTICRLGKRCLLGVIIATLVIMSGRSSPKRKEILRRGWITSEQGITQIHKEDSSALMQSVLI